MAYTIINKEVRTSVMYITNTQYEIVHILYTISTTYYGLLLAKTLNLLLY